MAMPVETVRQAFHVDNQVQDGDHRLGACQLGVSPALLAGRLPDALRALRRRDALLLYLLLRLARLGLHPAQVLLLLHNALLPLLFVHQARRRFLVALHDVDVRAPAPLLLELPQRLLLLVDLVHQPLHLPVVILQSLELLQHPRRGRRVAQPAQPHAALRLSRGPAHSILRPLPSVPWWRPACGLALATNVNLGRLRIHAPAKVALADLGRQGRAPDGPHALSAAVLAGPERREHGRVGRHQAHQRAVGLRARHDGHMARHAGRARGGAQM
mmetsp:Transcript_4075/g.10301  ORF Transcript_4075/g.10301 Transcript_4075/m.10301 type:complete len:272 (-) Transcript_4075:85-900(-)